MKRSGACSWAGAQRARGLMPAGEMNKTEAAYAAHLETRRQVGEVLCWRFEAHKLKLAGNTFYTPDFEVMLANGLIEFHEVKGYWQEDARVKIKVAAEQFPQYAFLAVKMPRRHCFEYEAIGGER